MALRWKRITAVLVGMVLVLFAAAVTATVGWRVLLFGPRSRPLTSRTFEKTSEHLERGRYLVQSVFSCIACHSERDWTAPGAPVRAGRAAAGYVWAAEGLPWLTAPNLTPDRETGIGGWSDDTLARAIREGIGHDGRALFPMMPYPSYRRIPDEDLAAIIVYLRTLEPVHHHLPATKVPFPLSQFIKAVPAPLEGPVGPPDLSTPEKRGEYLVQTIECGGCHTPRKQGREIRGLHLAGGFVVDTPLGKVASTNLTPAPSGIPYYDAALFVEAMRTGTIKGRTLSPMMPWVFFRGMTDEDLLAMFAYLRTVAPAAHHITNTDPPTECRRCGAKHGLGEMNSKS